MHLLFDLDGTLTDSFPGIGRCINHALAALGRDQVPDARLRVMVGSPLTAIFGDILESDDESLIDRAVAAYRLRFTDVGIFENDVFPGIPEALRAFRVWGHALQIVTAKPAVMAARVVRHFGIGDCFDAIHGPELTDRGCDKAALVEAALTRSGGRHIEAVMIGDRVDDIRAAQAHGIAAVAAGWGYGARSELTAAQPDFIAESVADLVTWIRARHSTL
jgi:phosphoglycolate phosphatase